MFRIEHNVETGEIKQIELSAAEVKQLEKQYAEAKANDEKVKAEAEAKASSTPSTLEPSRYHRRRSKNPIGR
jgi:hypothetical protein